MRILNVIIACLLAGLVCAGCKSVSSDSSALAGVVIRGNTPGQINRAAEQVFSSHGYKLMLSGPTTAVYEKKGSTSTTIAYGNWMGTPVMMRIRTKIVPIGEAVFRLECTAARVRDAGSSTEEELPIRMKSGPYDKMLKEVQAKLTGAGGIH